MRAARRPVGLALLGWFAAAVPLPGQQTPATLVRFLRQSIGLDSAQLAAVERGAAVVKVLDTKNQRDVAVFGIITADVPRQRYVAHLQDFPSSLRAPTRTRFGIFSDPAIPADVQDLVVDQHDVSEVKDCHPDDCKIKLPATEMKRLHEEIDWSAADPQVQVNAYARQGYWSTLPTIALAGTRRWWSTTIVGTFARAAPSPPDLPSATFVAGKQIYSDHYFEAGFDLTTVVDRTTAAGAPGIYLVLLRRSRFDDLPTGLFNIRGKVIGKLRDQMRADLEREKATAEQTLGS